MNDIDRRSAEIDAYIFTTGAIACLERAFKDLFGARPYQGRRMRTGGGVVVTPDLTFEAGKGSDGSGYRAVCEIKSSLPRHPSALDQLVRQMRHYDCELVGWEIDEAAGGRRDNHNIVIAVRSRAAPDFAAKLPAALEKGGVEIKNPLSIVGIAHRVDGHKKRFVLGSALGTVSRRKADEALARGWTIDADDLTSELDGVKFYDSRPPVPYTMSILWVQVFAGMVHSKKLKRLNVGAAVVIDAEVGRIHRLVSKLAPSSNPGCVKKQWIRDCMEEFVRIGLAEWTAKDRYKIRYTLRKSHPLEWFSRLTAA